MFCILQDIFNVKYDILYLKKYHHTDIQFSMSALAENISLPKHTILLWYALAGRPLCHLFPPPSLPAISIKNSLKDSRINS